MFHNPWTSRILAIALLLGTGAWVFLGGAPDRDFTPTQSSNQAPLVETTTFTPETYAAPITLTGFTRAQAEDTLSFNISGTITNILVQKGDTVTKGQVLATLDDQIEQANLKRAQAQVTLLEERVKRLSTLSQSGAASKTAVDEAQTSLIDAQSALVSAQEALQDKTLIAPFNGRINDVTIDEGVHVAAGTQAIHLVNDSTIYIDVFFSREEYDNLDKTQSATVDQIHTAKLTFLSDTATENRTFKGEYTLTSKNPIPLNSRVTIKAFATPVQSVPLDLNTIVVDPDGRTGIMIAKDNKAKFLPVTVLSSGTKTWVAGIEKTADIITSGQNSVSDEQEIRTQ